MVEVVAAAVCVVAGVVLLGRLRPLERTAPPSVRPGSVSIVIPARNEASSLPALLESIGRSAATPLEVLVVDDGSTDDTAEIGRSAGAEVLHAPPPPDGWNGKPWACWLGASRAAGDHVLFLDADVTLAPDALSRLCATHDGGLLSVQPFHRTERHHESLSGVFNLVSMMGSGAFALFPQTSGRRATGAVAFGPCLFTSKADYDAAGGHRAVRGEIVEDAALAHRYAAEGIPVRCFAGRDAIAFRMYPDGLRTLVDGWTRTLAAGSRAARRVPVALAVLWVAACGAVAIGAARAALSGDSRAITLALALYAVVAATVGALQARIGSFRWWSWVAYPLPLVCFVGVFVRSLWCLHVRRQVVWRSRRVPLQVE